MRKSVLITGGSGLLGTALTDLLLQAGLSVSHLSRDPSWGKIKCFRWSVQEKYIDPKALQGVDAIIHLAGAGVAEKRWTIKRKKEIIESRTKSSNFLFEVLRDTPNHVQTVLSASAIGYYGLTTLDDWCHEERKPGSDFLAGVCDAWESSIKPIEELSKRLVIFRIGVVLSNRGGALTKMAKPIKWGVGIPLGSGRQWISWIHVDDLCQMFLLALENEAMKGSYNAVAPNPVTNHKLNEAIAKILRRPLWVVNIPDFVLKTILGEMYQIVVSGSKVSCDKIKSAGFGFAFSEHDLAIKNLLS